MSLDEPEPVDSVLTFLIGYDILEYSWVKATAVFVRLRILFVTLQNTNIGLLDEVHASLSWLEAIIAPTLVGNHLLDQ